MTKYEDHTIQLKTHRGKTKLYLIGDFHIGHRQVHLDYLHTVIDMIRRERAYWIGMGDYGNADFPGSKYYDRNNVNPKCATPDKQYNYVVKEMLYPIRNKCLGLLAGNHDQRHWFLHGHNYVDILSHDLGIKYLSYDCYYRLHFHGPNQKRNINFYLHHGHGASRSGGAKVNNLERLMLIFLDVDVYAMGHTHTLGSSPSIYPMTVNDSLRPIHQKKHFISTGGFLKGYDLGESSYVSRKALPPLGIGSIKLIIQPFASIKFKNEYGKKWCSDELKITVEEVPL